MFGTILNAAAIVVGGVVGLTTTRQLSPVNQTALKILLGVFTTYVGLNMVWQGLNGPFFQILKQLGIVLLALILGNVTGKLLRFQKSLNRLGRFAREKLSAARPDSPHRINDGFVTCSVLFCVGPMAVLGALFDGLTGNFMVLAAKAVMDGLATMAFVTTFGWGAITSALPVVAYQGTITLLGQMLHPYLQANGLLDSVIATGGFLVFCIALVILELKKIELADYLPSLAFAPLLASWTGVWR